MSALFVGVLSHRMMERTGDVVVPKPWLFFLEFDFVHEFVEQPVGFKEAADVRAFFKGLLEPVREFIENLADLLTFEGGVKWTPIFGPLR